MKLSTIKSWFRDSKQQLFPIAILLLAVVGIILALLPSIQKQMLLQQQNYLLGSIVQGNGEITLDQKLTNLDWNFYAPDIQNSTEQEVAPDSIQADAKTPISIKGIGVLSINSIDLCMPVTSGVSETQLKIAAGHVPETAPVGSEGNAVIAAHRSYTYGDFFNRLEEVKTGDIIQYQEVSGETMEFSVMGVETVPPEDQTAFFQPVGQRQLTLYTCTPVRTATHRLLVRAERIK